MPCHPDNTCRAMRRLSVGPRKRHFGSICSLLAIATSPANVVCTKQYRPLENLYHGKGTVVLKPSMDVWPCGCIFYELFVVGGHLLFQSPPCTEGVPLPILSQRCRDLVAHRCRANFVDDSSAACIVQCTSPVEARINIQTVVRKWLGHPAIGL